jgi:hypothetical protein
VTRTTSAHEELLGRDEREVAVVGGHVLADLDARHLHLHTAGRGHRERLQHVVGLAE